MLFNFSLLSAIKGRNTNAELQENFSSLRELLFFRGKQPNFRGEWLFAMMNGRFSVMKLKDACTRHGYTGFTAFMKQRYRLGVWVPYGKPEGSVPSAPEGILLCMIFVYIWL